MSIFRLFKHKEANPRQAYNRWAASYDNQAGNLMLDLDEAVFSALLNGIVLEGKQVVDIGCGTGRHWARIIVKGPLRLAGYDVSEEMLRKLRQKFPYAETNRLHSEKLEGLEDGSCEVVISTLTIAHIRNAPVALKEWSRVLCNGGDLLITDYHPATLEKGGQRTFTHEGKTVAVKNYIHSIATIRHIAAQLGLAEVQCIEKIIDETVKVYYEKRNALDVYEKYKGTAVIYGIHLKKSQ